MSSTSLLMPENGIQVHGDAIIPSETETQPLETALRLPSISELLTHLRLIDAIICLKTAIDSQGEAHKMEAGKAWDLFCRAAALKFLEWSENVDVSEKTIPIPPLDILMIWHSYMLNTKDYVQFQNKARRGELAGKGLDWQELERRLDLDYDGMHDILGSWDPIDKAHASRLEELSRAEDFDMVAAVQRQLKFAAKMHHAQWRNPKMVNKFLDTAISNYEEFFTLIAENPGMGFAPTLAIDLVWHTHQLSPRRYRTYCRHMTNGRFIHHNDNIDEALLEEASHNAEEIYFAKYGVPYKRSMCCAADVCLAPHKEPGTELRGAAVKPEDPSYCSSACRSGCASACSSACRSGCANYCRGGLCRDQCRAACGYVCGACETKSTS